jgi:hypothetical protein
LTIVWQPIGVIELFLAVEHSAIRLAIPLAASEEDFVIADLKLVNCPDVIGVYFLHCKPAGRLR